MINENGIPSDVEAFTTQLAEFGTNIYGEKISIDDLFNTPTGFTMIANQLNKLQYNKVALTKAVDQLYSKGGLEEAAITTNGQVIVRDAEGNMKSISISELSKNPAEYQTVSNNELLQMRTYAKNGAFNNQMVSILQNGEGMENVTKQLQYVIRQLKTTKMSRDQFMSPDQVEALRGINELQGLVKVNNSQEGVSNDNAQAALSYLYSTLSQSARNLLRLKGAQQGKDPDEGALELISKLIQTNSKTVDEQKIDISNVSGGSLGKKGSQGQVTAPDFRTAIQNDMFNLETTELNLGTRMSIISNAYTFNRPHTKDGKALEQGTSIKDVLTEAFGGTVNSNSIYIGNQKINVGDTDRIAYTGEQGAVVTLPAKYENGALSPDFDAIERLSEAEAKIKAEGISDPVSKQAVYEQHGVWQYADMNPNKSQSTAQFVQLPVYTYDTGLLEDTSSPFYRKLSGKEEDKIGRAHV